MAWHLFRLGRWSFLHRRVVAAAWVLLLAALAVGSATLAGQTSDDFELDGIESTQAFELIEQRTPDASPDGATARVVFEAPEGASLGDPAYRGAVTDALASLQGGAAQSVTDPFTGGTLSQDGRVGYATVGYTVTAVDLPAADKTALEDAKDAAEAAGLRVAIGGDALAGDFEPPLAELVGIGVALVVLALTFGSLVAAGMPLLTALVGVGVGALSISTLSGFVELGSTTPALGTMLGLAVGIDYALFIMSRYRHEVRLGRPLEEAAGRAVGTAGSAVVFAGLTVIIALAGLSVCGVGFLTQMGLGGAFTVALAVLIALTLLPALLGFAGRRVTSGRLTAAADRDPEDETQRTNGRRWAELVSRHRWKALVAGVGLAAVAALPVASMQLALPDDASKPVGSDARVAYDLIADHFGAGANGPLLVVVDTARAADPGAALATATADISALAARSGSDIATVVPSAVTPEQLAAVGYATITVVPGSGPSDEATKQLVADLRTAVADLPDDTGARALVTGQTAVGVDISNELSSVFPLYLAVVVGLAFILLVVVFRSLWVPLKAALGFLLSVGVSLGATVAVFQWGWLGSLLGLDTTAPVLFLLPILLTGILFGLAMDYEVFLVTRMREAYVHGTPARRAVVDGFAHSARVVVAAAVIMIGVFAGFALTDDVILKTIGFALAVGVLADALLVRMTIVPAVMAIVGERIWWLPRWLDRLVPDLDIEGERLGARLDPAPAPELATTAPRA
ncbi:MMPL family transporter [Nocardioides anomalus]|uniref:MMPL family transporter n=1 Tax=Nocardioides anomalus TaxID=2712223 RepID=A0A6G6WJK6_9ACTN|nr:MMPL family transporter [Nocardioides anomalus]QIG45275.1 MMPL family transporter [Nocardioides anomalus]